MLSWTTGGLLAHLMAGPLGFQSSLFPRRCFCEQGYVYRSTALLISLLFRRRIKRA
jgi:hypothetical protein